jgi:hypothetical protein
MHEDVIIPWLLYRSTIWAALLAGLATAAIANFKRRPVMGWYLYGSPAHLWLGLSSRWR